MDIRFGLVYPTRRAGCIENVVRMWESRAPGAHLTWCAGINQGDEECRTVATHLGLLVAETGDNYVAGVNAAAERLAPGVDVLIVVSDDFVPPNNWAKALESVIKPLQPIIYYKSDFAVHVNDGCGDLATLPILSAARYRRFKYVCHPSYQSLFSDTEFTMRAKLDGVLIDARHILFEHMHPVNRKRPADEVDAQHASQVRWDEGKIIYNHRLAIGFSPDHNPTDVPPTHLENYIASIQTTRDDVCLKATVDSLFDGGVRNFMFNMPKHHWDGTIVPASDHAQVVAVAEYLVNCGAWHCRCAADSLATVYWPEMSRGMLETNYRNYCLQRLRKLGFKHQLIVDGDEIFMPGALAAVDYNVRVFEPDSAALRGVPVLGLPAVAVEGATDRITCYMGATDIWRDVRSPHKPVLDIQHLGVLHLSGVRRTREEIVAKMRKSGHYDDADYRFDEWISDVLPVLRPGMKNVHMYRDGALWPLSRELNEREWAAIPAELKPLMWGGQ